MKRQRIPLVGSPTGRGSSLTDLQTFINCLFQVTKNNITGQGQLKCLKRQGYDLSQTLAAAGFAGQPGAVYWSGAASALSYPYFFSVSNATTHVTRIYDNNGTQLGADIATADSCLSLTETTISNVPTLIAVVYDNAGALFQAYWYSGAGPWTRISDADYPPNATIKTTGDPVHKDGYMFIMDIYGRIWNSDLNSVINWTATSYVDAQQSPDGGSGLALYNNMVVAFGQKSIEFFQNSGNATGSPLTRVQGSKRNIGAVYSLSFRTILPVNDTVYWWGFNPETGTQHIYRLNGMQEEKVSNAALDEVMNVPNSFASFDLMGTITNQGMTHVVVRDPYNQNHWAFCIDTGQWWRLKFATSSTFTPKSLLGFYAMGSSTRELYVMSSSSFKDSATTITMTIQTDELDQGTNKKKFYHAADLLCDSQSTSGDISISWSDDGFASFSTARTIDPSSGAKRITRLGSTQRKYNNRRAWKIVETVDRPFRGDAIELWYTEGQS